MGSSTSSPQNKEGILSKENNDKNNNIDIEENESDNNMIYSLDKKKVSMDDFATLKLIGVGNFAKVFFFFNFIKKGKFLSSF
jgi:hypothetical protein